MNTARYIAFKSFCQKILKATQISCACIVLALYYIHRLRSAYPAIRASTGSEVRLFTTALVLANKYLDDNTFTNKTWSDVSSIPVNELNIMEMEFLSALQYNIHIPDQQFFIWVSQCQQWFPFMQCTTATSTPAAVSMTPVMMYPPLKRTIQEAMLHQPSQQAQPASYATKRRYHQIPVDMPTMPTLKRTAQEAVLDSPYATKRRHQMPFTPPDEPLAIPPYPSPYDVTICRPILSWSSSSSALASSRQSSYALYSNNPTNNHYHHNLTSRVQCLEIE
ncbi:hypothetical protein EC973_001843 [Apophysomyces ossiformis]|uniref:Cyclin-domain-containing protein n=1 Tax=Apophysomyces ossiformis TaxID=679940 RepID=A0A8H7BHD6_9FUNG|nr:hypothetical protein EC973_001843 [Apophysomyces ossiformis]